MASKDDKAKIEQILGEYFVKAANTILSSRIYQSSRILPKQQTPQKSWFNLEVEEVLSAREEVQQWRHEAASSSPLVVEVYQLPWGPEESKSGQPPIATGIQAGNGGGSAQTGVLLERWTIHWQQEKRSTRTQSSRLEPAAIYKRLVIMLRSLFTYVRVLPAFRLYKACRRNKASSFSLHYHLKKGFSGESLPYSSGSTGKLQSFQFTPIETLYGFLKMAVEYQPSRSIKVLEQTTPPTGAPHIISDYVGSQRSKSSLPRLSNLSASLSGNLTPIPPPPAPPGATGGMQVLQQPASPILRRHSWSLSTAQRAQSSGEMPAGTSHQQQQAGTYARSTSLGPNAQGLPQLQTRGSRGFSPSAFAPNTPTAAATPPKYPSGGLASRVQQAAVQAAAKLYPVQGRGPSPSSRGSPARGRSRQSNEEMQTFRAPSKSSGASVSVPENKAVEANNRGTRLASKPVRIPGSEQDSRRLHSSEDLRMLVHEGLPRPSVRKCPSKTAASAPAAPTYFGFNLGPPNNAASKPTTTPFQMAPRHDRPIQPDTPPVLQTLPSLGSESSGSACSSFPASCSPQLPFAFTPSNHSFTSAADAQQRREFGFAGVVGPSPPAKDNSPVTALAVVRKPSWTNKSSSFEGASGAPNVVGYSVSPILDSMESSHFSSSTPKNAHQLPFSLPSRSSSSPLAQHTAKGGSSHSPSGGSLASAGGPPRLTFPMDAALLASDETDAESLPFALDRESSIRSFQAGSQKGASSPGCTSDPAMSAVEAGPDAAVGAFVRLIQEAPPLQRSELIQDPGTPGNRVGSTSSSSELSLQAGLDQLERLKTQLTHLHGFTTAPALQQGQAKIQHAPAT